MQDRSELAKIQRLEDQVAEQGRLLAQKDEQLRDQAEIIQQLRNYPQSKSLEDLVHVDRIEIERLSGAYDEDRDGVPEGVAVYLRLFDRDGDTIKASGRVRVKLLDLANPPDQQLLGQIELGPKELLSRWFGRLLTSHFSIKVPWGEGVPKTGRKNVTVVVTFLESLSGRDFQAQRVVSATRK